LIVLAEFEEIEAKLLSCNSMQDIKWANEGYTVFKSACRDLLGMSRTACNRLESCVKSALADVAKEATVGRATATEAQSKRRKVAAPPTQQLLDFAHAECMPIPSITLEKMYVPASKPDPTKPIIFRWGPDNVAMDQDGDVGKHSIAFGTKFAKDAVRIDPGRAQRKTPEDVARAVCEMAAKIFDDVLPTDKLKDAVIADICPSTFAIASSRTTCSAEGGHLPTLRLGFCGTRQVVAIRTQTVIDFIQNTDKSAKVDCKIAYGWLKTATLDGFKALKAFVESGAPHIQPFYASVGVGDAMYLPAGWMLYEKIGSKDFVGVRVGFLRHADHAAPLDQHGKA
jgi:hypothetical protein